MMNMETYDNPLITRYASREMAAIWSPPRRIGLWRRLWIVLAETQQELGLAIRDEQLEALRASEHAIDWQAAEQWERKLRHDVMAHVHTYGDAAPAARAIIHLGATSCYVTDNADLMLIREAGKLLLAKLVRAIDRLADFAQRHRDTACLAFTHLQPAQPTTLGKRATLWAYDLCLDVDELEHRLARLRARSVKGTTGTQASFLKLFGGDHAKVKELERRVAAKIGFQETYAVTGQTYSRKVDAQWLATLSGIAQSAHKFASDVRLLASRRELDEPIEESQVGSSAMAYKRNPMRSERVCGLARFLMALEANTSQTAAQQWLERTLDDSANRRLTIPQAFLAADAILILLDNVASGMVAYPRVLEKNLRGELPFMATENLLMAAVERGGDRQALHEVIRRHSHEVSAAMKSQGAENDLWARLQAEPGFAGLPWEELLDTRHFVGRAPEQVDEFIAAHIEPLRRRYPEALGTLGEVRV